MNPESVSSFVAPSRALLQRSDSRKSKPAGAPFAAGRLVGESPVFRRTVAAAERFARAEAPVLVTGATGTGKELFARAIHYGSPRAGKPFVALNCAALPETLAENELFGHARGAYTHAESGSQGLVAEAEGGTLLLDEVDSLSLGTQAKLLRFLQDLEYRRLGESRSRRADVRLVVATNADLGRRVAERRFRADLFYRLAVLRLQLPDLAERRGDVGLLARYLLSRLARRQGRAVPRLTQGALRRLEAHTWPGNVRELEAVLQRAFLLTASESLEADDLDLPSVVGGEGLGSGGATGDGAGSTGATDGELTFQEAKAAAVRRFERAYLEEVLSRCRGNVSRAAREARTERSSFQRLMRKHGLQRGQFACC